MGYMRAEDILPPELLLLVQNYADGIMLYIPKKRVGRNEWGSVSGSKVYYRQRNAMICEDFRSGAQVRDLEEKYCLSQKSIQRILRGGSKLADGKEEHESGEQKKSV